MKKRIVKSQADYEEYADFGGGLVIGKGGERIKYLSLLHGNKLIV